MNRLEFYGCTPGYEIQQDNDMNFIRNTFMKLNRNYSIVGHYHWIDCLGLYH